MEEIGDRTTVFEFGGLRDRQRDYIDWVLKASLDDDFGPDDVLTDDGATLLAAKLKTPLQVGQHLVRASEAGFEIGAKPIDAGVIDAVLSRHIDDLEPQLTRNGYDLRSLVEQFDAKPAEIRKFLRGDLDPGRSQELMDEMRAAELALREMGEKASQNEYLTHHVALSDDWAFYQARTIRSNVYGLAARVLQNLSGAAENPAILKK